MRSSAWRNPWHAGAVDYDIGAAAAGEPPYARGYIRGIRGIRDFRCSETSSNPQAEPREIGGQDGARAQQSRLGDVTETDRANAEHGNHVADAKRLPFR